MKTEMCLCVFENIWRAYFVHLFCFRWQVISFKDGVTVANILMENSRNVSSLKPNRFNRYEATMRIKSNDSNLPKAKGFVDKNGHSYITDIFPFNFSQIVFYAKYFVLPHPFIR